MNSVLGSDISNIEQVIIPVMILLSGSDIFQYTWLILTGYRVQQLECYSATARLQDRYGRPALIGSLGSGDATLPRMDQSLSSTMFQLKDPISFCMSHMCDLYIALSFLFEDQCIGCRGGNCLCGCCRLCWVAR